MPLESEVTPIGQQSLVPGVTPITSTDRLTLRAAAPMRSRGTRLWIAAKPQKPADHGLFDLNARERLMPVAPKGD